TPDRGERRRAEAEVRTRGNVGIDVGAGERRGRGIVPGHVTGDGIVVGVAVVLPRLRVEQVRRGPSGAGDEKHGRQGDGAKRDSLVHWGLPSGWTFRVAATRATNGSAGKGMRGRPEAGPHVPLRGQSLPRIRTDSSEIRSSSTLR